jgi:hypothetical protein
MIDEYIYPLESQLRILSDNTADNCNLQAFASQPGGDEFQYLVLQLDSNSALLLECFRYIFLL